MMMSPTKMLLSNISMQLIVLNIFLLIFKFKEANGQNFDQSGQLSETPLIAVRHNSTNSTGSNKKEDGPNWACECGISSVNRIIGGTETAPHRFPWLVFLQISKNGQTFQCGGFLATDKHVVTAAHCTHGASGGSVMATMGVHNIAHPEFGSVKIASREIHNHPSYNAFGNSEDIAVVTLKTPVKFSATIRPLCLPTSRGNYSGQQATIAGWGTLSEEGQSSDVLMEASVRVWEDDTCKGTYAKRGITITDAMICAGGSSIDTCQGDSGGPLLFEKNGKFTAIGVVSFGIGCARPNIPGVYSRVDNLIEFVNKVIGSIQSCP